jgi:hypothetical protein
MLCSLLQGADTDISLTQTAVEQVTISLRVLWLITVKNLLKFCTTLQTGGSRVRFPNGVIGIFQWHNSTGRTMAVWSTQPLKEMSTRIISWEAKAAGALGWQPYHHPVPLSWNLGIFNFLEPSGPLQACNGTVFTDPKTYLFLLWTILFVYVVKKFWCQLPEEGQIITPKHVAAM